MSDPTKLTNAVLYEKTKTMIMCMMTQLIAESIRTNKSEDSEDEQ